MLQSFDYYKFWAAANTWLLAGTVHGRKHTVRPSVTFAEATEIQLYMHMFWMYTQLNFGYLCDGYIGVWSLLFPVMDCTYKLLLVYVSHSENVLMYW
jgi:hypothetical protein